MKHGRLFVLVLILSILITNITSATPTTITLDSNKHPIKTISGYKNPQKFVSKLTNEKVKQLKEKISLLYKSKDLNLYLHIRDNYLNISNIEYAMTVGASGDSEAKLWAEKKLNFLYQFIDLNLGGIYLFSNQGDWKHPHYEKTLITNAGYLRLYAEASQYWHNQMYLFAAQQIANYIHNYLTSPEGAFYADQSTFVTPIKQEPHNYHLNEKNRGLLSRPQNSKHIYTDANGITINSLVYIHMVQPHFNYLHDAIKATQWIIKNNRTTDGGFFHSTEDRTGFHLSDNLAMSIAFLTLYRATTDKKYLILSQQTMNFIDKLFKNPSGNAGFITYLPSKIPMQFKPTLSTYENYMMVRIAHLLYYYSENNTYQEMAKNGMRYLTSPNVIDDVQPTMLLLANLRMTTEPLQIIIVGSKNNTMAKQLHSAALAYPSFYVRIEWYDNQKALSNAGKKFLTSHKPAAYVCVNFHCSFAIFTPQQLTNIIQKLVKDPHLSRQIINQKVKNLSINTNYNLTKTLNKEPIIFVILGFFLVGIGVAFTPYAKKVIMRSNRLHSAYYNDYRAIYFA